jgi:hypothetical protein
MHTESQLALPAIEVIRAHGGRCDTSDLIESLKGSLTLDSEDKELLPSGFSIRFDQITRNLKCNKHLLNMGLVEHYQGGFMLTDKGREIDTKSLKTLIVKHFAPRTNVLSNQQAMVKYVRDIARIGFKDSKLAAGEIRKGFKSLLKVNNDDDRIAAVAGLVNDYVSNNPSNMK